MRSVQLGKDYEIFGGPYLDKPYGMFGVKMAAEIDAGFNVSIPTVDFSVPDVTRLRMGVMKTLVALKQDKEVYVGCMGGIGRTGLFMAAIMMVVEGKGVDEVIQKIRHEYHPHAVETAEQRKFLYDIYLWDIARWSKIL